jgi:hypothetical protein
MKETKTPEKLTGLVRATSEHVKHKVNVQKNLSEPLRTSMGLRQRDVLSCILFNIREGGQRLRDRK